MMFTAQCLVCKTRYEANNAASMAEWYQVHETPGTPEYRLHQIEEWTWRLKPDWMVGDLTAAERLEQVEEILRGALSGDEAPVTMA